MKFQFNRSTRRARRTGGAAVIAAALLPVAGASLSGGCLTRPIEQIEPRSTSTIFEQLTQSSVDSIDLVLAIDNSRSMADKQQILSLAVPDLVKGLVNPRCVDEAGVAAAMQPEGPLEPCPVPGTEREFQPVVDIHIGIISSSIGGHGSDACPSQDNATCGATPNFTHNDKGHLLSRTSACGGGNVATYQEKGFLAWDPGQKLNPAGEANMDALVKSLREMVVGVGQIGCGYEAQLESWYRFLVDPEPYETITAVNGKAMPEGRDEVLLAQRADFLRPGSLLAILMLSDENDCSIKESAHFFYAAQQKNQDGTLFRLPAARAECATNPNDPCCMSCGQKSSECPPDPTCLDEYGNPRLLSPEEDDSNLRCFDQKRRFGMDFLYPIDRYTKALSSSMVPNRAGALVPNPLFSDLNPKDDRTNIRDPGLVFLAGIVGVPWQDIAVDANDLTKGFKTSKDLAAVDPQTKRTTWDLILGDPASYVPPQDPFMVESIAPRAGKNPRTGDPIVAPGGSPKNAINGSEHPAEPDDLQYACTFKLPAPTDCSKPGTSCDCTKTSSQDPLCEEDPNKPGEFTMQVRAKAYPGTRELHALRDLGDQGIVASVCAKQIDDPMSADFGYRPAMGAIIERLKQELRGQCLPRTLTPDAAGQVPCLILEGRHVEEADAKACNACADPGRKPVDERHQSGVQQAQDDSFCKVAKCNCFCEVTQVSGADLKACQADPASTPLNKETGEEVNGWCYVDATTTPPTGNPEIVKDCAVTERRLIRFVGEGGAKSGSTLYITCSGDTAGGQ